MAMSKPMNHLKWAELHTHLTEALHLARTAGASSRALSLVQTKLEEAQMWAEKIPVTPHGEGG